MEFYQSNCNSISKFNLEIGNVNYYRLYDFIDIMIKLALKLLGYISEENDFTSKNNYINGDGRNISIKDFKNR